MSYRMELRGEFEFNRQLTMSQFLYLNKFCETVRVKWTQAELNKFGEKDKIRKAAGLPLGEEGAYYVGDEADSEKGYFFQNRPAATGQPSHFCCWQLNEDGSGLIPDENDQAFDYYHEWLVYLIEHFFKPWGYVLNGKVIWEGEEFGDKGTIYAENNVVSLINQQESEEILIAKEKMLRKTLEKIYDCIDGGRANPKPYSLMIDEIFQMVKESLEK